MVMSRKNVKNYTEQNAIISRRDSAVGGINLLRNYFIQPFYGLIQLFQGCFTNDFTNPLNGHCPDLTDFKQQHCLLSQDGGSHCQGG
jgi:hypothetical protein